MREYGSYSNKTSIVQTSSGAENTSWNTMTKGEEKNIKLSDSRFNLIILKSISVTGTYKTLDNKVLLLDKENRLIYNVASTNGIPNQLLSGKDFSSVSPKLHTIMIAGKFSPPTLYFGIAFTGYDESNNTITIVPATYNEKNMVGVNFTAEYSVEVCQFLAR